MSTIKIIKDLRLFPEKGGVVIKKNRGYLDIHRRQGDLDGACAVYSLVMALMIIRKIDKVKFNIFMGGGKGKGPMINLLRELFCKDKGMHLQGNYLWDIGDLAVKKYRKQLICEYEVFGGQENKKDRAEKIIAMSIDQDLPALLGINKKTLAHAILAIGYEKDEDTDEIRKIFCLDPGYELPLNNFWNCFLDIENGKGHQAVYCSPGGWSDVFITDALVVKPR